MRRHAPRWMAALAAAAAPAIAAGFSYGGSVGGLYLNETYMPDEGPTVRRPSLEFDGNLHLSGSVFRPGLLDYDAGAGYRRLRLTQNESTSRSESVSWGGSASILGTRGSPVHLSLATSRGWADSWQVSDRAGTLGSALTTTYSANASYRSFGRPTLSVMASQTEIDQRVAGIALGTVRSKNVAVATGSGTGPFSYAFSYSGAWLEGTSPLENYQSHTAGGHAELRLGQDSYAFFDESFYLRDPTAGAPPESRFELSRFFSGVRWGPPELLHRVDYGYNRAFRGRELDTNADSIGHSLGYSISDQLSPAFRLTGTAAAALTDARNGTIAERGAGQTVQALLDWTRQLRSTSQLALSGGALVGLLEVAGRDVQTAYGVLGGASVLRQWEAVSGQALYSGSFNSNVGGVAGWSLSHRGEATVSWNRAPDESVGGSLNFGVTRQYSRVFGDGARREVSLRGTARYHFQDFTVRAGLTSGIADPTKNSFAADGLFLQPPYDVESRFAVAESSTRLARNLTVSLFAAYSVNSTPGQANGNELFTGGTASYSLGALRISVEERYTVTEFQGRTQRQNRLMVLATRAFGGRF